MATYIPITKVEGFTKHGFPPVPALEQNLMALPQVVAWQTHLQRHLLLQQSTAP